MHPANEHLTRVSSTAVTDAGLERFREVRRQAGLPEVEIVR